ncbi:DNA polymerase III subunit delta [Mesorhizobium sp. M2A.F.Ca.ET.037.01.1.1]|uniref:DNA polymerase III subunit delta n=1 Tax=unclassified Mesorhizobium TaxID=325217 RepID=UPI000F763CBF|nr:MULTISPECIES: DNA polymerase III subunit delta [unclassified Mesorhizobium]RVC70094.1 DNA polymerase III subunit delta [Mesorhizobium sp. M00.F.Ca.ET.038.03.1.1]RVC75729.1 DNA polymerase III subunit delta [Mesorhizobium sp. M2A.F.Ca.ET.046.02.1.1]AZO35618.1 DNA polymerase III subunit delta [Mesorhizobium sp. M2A.F.Ca.ET.046.03.2.1]RUX23297.1 DNA polymerase III subunit delta [Mesorhizobium sp. M2A.F.Ca.ET.037.01.1.1]RWA83166.1 MAG: DNA polymerase III subunit delta [Mesorhizobium sp.]
MAQKKGYEVDSWLARPDPSMGIVLLYGPDRGLVAERAKTFAAKTGLPLDDPFSVVKLDGAEVDRDEGRLLDEARTVPMFSDRRLLWVRNASGQKALADDIKALTTEPARDAVILIEAGDLKKGTGLRAIVEAAGNAIALPCYADEARDLDSVIDDELRKAGMSMTLDARQALRRNLGGDRLASRGEIEKLVLYAHGRKEIGIEDINALSGDVSGASFDAAVDAMLDGKVGDFDIAFTRHCQSGGHPFLVLSSAMRQLQAIQVMRGQMESGGRNAASVVAGARPPVFFSRRKLVEKTLERWNVEALGRALSRLQTAVLQTRKRPDLSEALARQALLGIAIESARLGQR